MSEFGQSIVAPVQPTVSSGSNAGTSFWGTSGAVVPPTSRGKSAAPLADVDANNQLPLPPSSLVSDAKLVVNNTFNWLAAAADVSLSQLETDLLKEDAPSFSQVLLFAAVRVAAAGATGGASEFLANMVRDGGPVKEIIKSALRSGLNEGVAAGATALSGADKQDSIRAFITAQKKALLRAYQVGQTNWVLGGYKGIRTDDEAQALLAVCTPDQVEAAGAQQYAACRDAWVSYLAQARFGAVKSTAIDENGAVVDTGASSDLTSTEDRARRTGLGLSRHEGEEGPDRLTATLGVADGVLTVVADLPELHDLGGGLYGMHARPKVSSAYLGRVNARIRKQYENRPLASANVPRLIVCRVEGGQDFEVRINEQGLRFGRMPSAWLAARATVAQPWNVGKDEGTLKELGIDLLLNDLVTTDVDGGIAE